MAIEDFYDHQCDIFHLTVESQKRKYGLPDGKVYKYPDKPDISGHACHFSVKSGTFNLSQAEPQNELSASLKLTLPVGTDVRINDKIVDCGTGYEYVAEAPRNIRGHHLIVWIHRSYPKGV